MTAVDNTPQNLNFLSPLNFTFQLKRAPHVNFFLQEVNLPSLVLTSPQPNNPFVKTPIPGEHLDFGPLRIKFKVDEDLQNYLELFNWIEALGKPENWKQFRDIAQVKPESGLGIFSDISLIIASSTKMPNYEIVFTDAFPVSLDGFNLETTDQDVNYITASVEFKYTLFTIKKI